MGRAGSALHPAAALAARLLALLSTRLHWLPLSCKHVSGKILLQLLIVLILLDFDLHCFLPERLAACHDRLAHLFKDWCCRSLQSTLDSCFLQQPKKAVALDQLSTDCVHRHILQPASCPAKRPGLSMMHHPGAATVYHSLKAGS